MENENAESHHRGQDDSLGADMLVAFCFEQDDAENNGKEFRRADKNLNCVV